MATKLLVERQLAAPLRKFNRRPLIARAEAQRQHFKYLGQSYDLQQQSVERSEWAASVREVTGSRMHQFWEPHLDPPALLKDIRVVLVSPRRTSSVGTVCRALSCFEVEDLSIVQPRSDFITRESKSCSKGAQYILYKAATADSIADATSDCDLRVAFTRWVKGRDSATTFYDLLALTSHPIMKELIEELPSTTELSDSSINGADSPIIISSSSSNSTSTSTAKRRRRVALVFGREELGLSDAEVDACDVVCSIPIGRLQQRLGFVASQSGGDVDEQEGGMGSKYLVNSAQDLASGVDLSDTVTKTG